MFRTLWNDRIRWHLSTGFAFRAELKWRLGVHLVARFYVGSDGANPIGGVTRDASGNLYGTVYGPGAYSGGVVLVSDSVTQFSAFAVGQPPRRDGGTKVYYGAVLEIKKQIRG